MMSTGRTDNMLHYPGIMYDIVQVVVVLLFYVTAAATVFSAIRERCKNRLVIVFFMLVGMTLQTVYIGATFRNASNSYSTSNSASSSDFSLPNDMPLTQDLSTNLYGDVLVYRTRDEEIALTKHSNGIDAQILQNKNQVDTPNAVATKATLLNRVESFSGFRCADLRLLALVHYSLIFIFLLIVAVRQNVSKKRQTTVRYGVAIYVAILTGIIALLYMLKTSDDTDIFTFGTPLYTFQLVVCSQDARSQFLPIFLETVCLFGPSVGMLLMVHYRKTGGTQGKADRRSHIFQECRTADEMDCTACSGIGDILANVLVCHVGLLFIVRPIHYTYTYVTHGQFYDVWVIACVLILCASLSANNASNMISLKLDGRNSVPIQEKKSLGETKISLF